MFPIRICYEGGRKNIWGSIQKDHIFIYISHVNDIIYNTDIIYSKNNAELFGAYYLVSKHSCQKIKIKFISIIIIIYDNNSSSICEGLILLSNIISTILFRYFGGMTRSIYSIQI